MCESLNAKNVSDDCAAPIGSIESEVARLPIDGWPGYWIYSDGRIWSDRANGRFLVKTITFRGYVRYTLCKNGKQKAIVAHRLVAEAFIPNPENKPQVNHINGNKLDNRVENLEWNTAKENMRHAIAAGLIDNTKERSKVSKLTEKKALEIVELIKKGELSSEQISKMYNVSRHTIGNIKCGHTSWTKNMPDFVPYVHVGFGENHPRAKLKTSDVIEIKKMLKSGVKELEIANKFGVKRRGINGIKNGKNWSHVQAE
jgi:hypothetical protein